MSELNIFQKITKVMEDVNYLKKDGNVSFKAVNYNYLSEQKTTTAVRKAMIEHGLIMYPKFVQNLENSNEFLDEIIVTYRLVNIENPDESIEIQTKGSGQDAGDKRTYKALTGAFKYAQRQLYMIPTGDDPDTQSTDENLEKIDKAAKSDNEKFIASIDKIKDQIPEKEFDKICNDFCGELQKWEDLTDFELQKEFFLEIKSVIKIFKKQEKNSSKTNGELPFK